MALRIKPHHFVDILRALGRGETPLEPHPYGHDFHRVAAHLLQYPDALLEIELGADEVCRPCRHNVGGLCDDVIDTSFRPDAPASKRQYNLLIDERWCRLLRLVPGQRLSARELSRRLRQRADELSDVYRENPATLNAARAEELRAGIARFLGAESPGKAS